MDFTSILSYLKTKFMTQDLNICHQDLLPQVKEGNENYI